jgi:hypothetical protein
VLLMGFGHRSVRYKELVTFYRPAASPTVNDDGGVDDAGDLFIHRRVNVWAVSGRERELGAQTVADVTHRVRVHRDRRTEEITPRMWIVRADGSTRLDVVRAFPLDKHPRVIEIECRERK